MANSANASACQKSLFAKLVGGGVNYPQFAMVTLLRLAACSVPLLIGLTSRCFAHWARASCAPRHCHPQFAMVVPRRAQSALAALPCSLGLLRPVSATGGGLRAPPYQFPLKSYGFPGAETAKKRFLLWKMGFSAAKIAPPPPYTPPGTIDMRKGFGPLALSLGFFDRL